MHYRRILVIAELGADQQAAFAAIRRFAPSAARATVVACQPGLQFGWLTPTAPAEVEEAEFRALDALHRAADGIALEVDVALTSELRPANLFDAVARSGIDLVVVGSPVVWTLAVVAEFRKRSSVPVLWVGSAPRSPISESGNRILCVGLGARARSTILAFLRNYAESTDRFALLSSTPLSTEDLRELREVSGIGPDMAPVVDRFDLSLRDLLDPKVIEDTDLVVLPYFAPAIIVGVASHVPVLVLSAVRPLPHESKRAMDMPDLVDDGTLVRARFEYAVGVGGRSPIADQEVAFVHEAEIAVCTSSVRGEAELPTGIGTALGAFRISGRDIRDPLGSMEVSVTVLCPGLTPLTLFDAEIEPAQLALIKNLAGTKAVGVRLRATRSWASLREKLRAAGLPPCVIDASTVLGEGDAADVPSLADAVRLARTAARMRAAGFALDLIIYRGQQRPVTRGFTAIPCTELGLPTSSSPPTPCGAPSVVVGRTSLADRLNATTGTEPIHGNKVEIELDNPTAREWLLSAINTSCHRVHCQVYMALDDDVGRTVEAALAAAGARGVAVRVLVDSLHGLHGSFGLQNPLLERLGSRPGVELRLVHPLTGLPSLEDLKLRDHRKLVVVDGDVALVGGRNLSHEYYAGFREVPLEANMTWRKVPWLDAGARVRGPAVAALERSFLAAWTDAGGEPFSIVTPAPAGNTPARVVVHHGMHDAYTLEAYLALIETAQSHIYVVNGFPLLLEMQHALLRALRRGVRVRTLFGNLTPRHGIEPFEGPWATARIAATAFVHSRQDALIAAGGECYEFVVPRQPNWDEAVGDVRPHVHAKLMSADGLACAVGSANLDITAGYWESELSVVIEDEIVTRAVEARLDQLIAQSSRVDRSDPEWRRRAGWRDWMHYWPSVLSV